MTQPPPGFYPEPPRPGPTPGQPVGSAPPNHLVAAIMVTIFCCLPLGIAAIVKSAQVNGLWAQGLYFEAELAAESAKKFAIWAVVAGVIVTVIYILLAVAGNHSTS